MNTQYITAENLETLEQYGASLLSSMVSIRTFESFHVAAFKKGLFNDDEEECSKTICWELRRLFELYRKQTDLVLDRCDLNEADVLKDLKKLMPEVKAPRKRKSKKNG